MGKHRIYSRKLNKRRKRRHSRNIRGGEKYSRQDFEDNIRHDVIDNAVNIPQDFKNTLTTSDIDRLYNRYSSYNDYNRIKNDLSSAFMGFNMMDNEERPPNFSSLIDLMEQDADTSFEWDSENDGGGKKITLERQSKRKTNKSKKTRKHRRRRQHGGETNTITTEYLNPNDRDKKDYDQMLNMLNYNPKQ